MKHLITLTIFTAFISIAWAGESNQATNVPLVVAGTVTQAEDLEVRRYTGHVSSMAEVDLVPRVSAELLRVAFHEGDMVHEGQLLYELDPVRYEAAVKSAEARIEEAKARMQYAEITYSRNDELHRKNAITKDALDSTMSEYHASQAAVLNAEALLITAKDDLQNTKIYAPINGKIGTTHYTRGSFLTPSSGTISTIVQVDPLRVGFTMSSRDFLILFGNEKNLRERATVQLKLADGTVYPHAGTIDYIDNFANSRTDTLKIFVQFDNPDGILVPGNSLKVLLSHGGGGMVPAVVPSAIMHDSNGPYAYVIEENLIVRRDVRLGPATSTLQLIKSGLNTGELIVVDGTHKVRPGMGVEYKIEN